MKKQKDILDVLQQERFLTEDEANSKRTEMERLFPEYFTGADFNKLPKDKKTEFIEKLYEYVIGSTEAKRGIKLNSDKKYNVAKSYAFYRICELLEGRMKGNSRVDHSFFDHLIEEYSRRYQEAADSVSDEVKKGREQKGQN